MAMRPHLAPDTITVSWTRKKEAHKITASEASGLVSTED
jgi:hypothetical protein